MLSLFPFILPCTQSHFHSAQHQSTPRISICPAFIVSEMDRGLRSVASMSPSICEFPSIRLKNCSLHPSTSRYLKLIIILTLGIPFTGHNTLTVALSFGHPVLMLHILQSEPNIRSANATQKRSNHPSAITLIFFRSPTAPLFSFFRKYRNKTATSVLVTSPTHRPLIFSIQQIHHRRNCLRYAIQLLF